MAGIRQPASPIITPVAAGPHSRLPARGPGDGRVFDKQPVPLVDAAALPADHQPVIDGRRPLPGAVRREDEGGGYGAGAGEAARWVVWQGHQDRADRPPGLARRSGGNIQFRWVATAAFALCSRYKDRRDPEQPGLRRLADPAWPRHRDVGAEREQYREQQCLAARPRDDGAGARRQGAATPVAGRRRTQFLSACYRPVAANAGIEGPRA